LLSRGYWVASSGNVTDEVWMEYIKNQVPQLAALGELALRCEKVYGPRRDIIAKDALKAYSSGNLSNRAKMR